MTAPAARARREPRVVQTSAGELEPERRSARQNAIEAAAVYALVQVALWSGIASRQPAAAPLPRPLGLAVIIAVALYVIAAAPLVHGDSWHGLGLPKPFELVAVWRRSGTARRMAMAALAVAVPLIVAAAGWDSLLVRLGVRAEWPRAYARLIEPPWRQAGTAAAVIALGAATAAWVVRWSNLGRSARALALPALLALAAAAGAVALAAAMSGERPIAALAWPDGRGTAVASRFAAYLPWALLQQFLVLGYFNTRFRKIVPAAGWAGIPGAAITAGLTGAAFGAMHWPGTALVAGTGLAGCVFGWLFQKDGTRHLFLAALAHALAGALLASLTPIRMDAGPRL